MTKCPVCRVRLDDVQTAYRDEWQYEDQREIHRGHMAPGAVCPEGHWDWQWLRKSWPCLPLNTQVSYIWRQFTACKNHVMLPLEARQKLCQLRQLAQTRVHVHWHAPFAAEDTIAEPLLTKRYYRLRV